MKMTRFNAYTAAEHIRNNLIEFMLEWRHVNNSDIKKQIRELWLSMKPEDGGVISEPLLESNFSYESDIKNTTLKALAKENPGLYDNLFNLAESISKMSAGEQNLPSGLFNGIPDLQKEFMRNILKEYQFPTDRVLYNHQLQALTSSLERNKDLIISAGTGSGKSECFLLPSLVRLLNESPAELAEPGVRVLIIYPKNALINSQMRRIQSWLGTRSDIKFGFYSSKLKEDFNSYNAYTNRQSPYCKWPNNQVFSRKELRKSPPHILISNFSMMEYALVRMKDQPLFEHNKLHTIVLDEAHSYSGSMAAEITMLIRRLRVKLNKEAKDIHFFATSATLGDPERDGGAKMKQFAASLFSKDIEDIDVILGKKKADDLPDLKINEEIPLACIADRFMDDNFGWIENIHKTDSNEIFSDSTGLVVNKEASEKLRNEFNKTNDFSKDQYFFSDQPSKVLWSVINRIPEIRKLRREILKEPLKLEEISEFLFNKNGLEYIKITANIMVACSVAVDAPFKLPIIPVKLHLTASAPNGVFVCLSPNCPGKGHDYEFGRIVQNKYSSCENECDSGVGELVTCKACGEIFVAFNRETNLPPDWEFLTDEQGLLDVKTISGTPVSWNKHCPACLQKVDKKGVPFFIKEEDKENESEEDDSSISADYELDADVNRDFNGLFFQSFNIGHHLIQPILIDSLYECLDPMNIKGYKNRPGQGRKLLAFTDNRVKAAALASRMEWTHEDILNRHIIYTSISNSSQNTLTRSELQKELSESSQLKQLGGFFEKLGKSPDEIMDTDESTLWHVADYCIDSEFFRKIYKKSTRLEATGLVTVGYSGLENIFDGYSFEDISGKSLVVLAELILDLFRMNGIISIITKNTAEQTNSVDLWEYCFGKTYYNNAITAYPHPNANKLVSRYRPKQGHSNKYEKTAIKFLISNGYKEKDAREKAVDLLISVYDKIKDSGILISEKYKITDDGVERWIEIEDCNNAEFSDKAYKINTKNMSFSIGKDIYVCQQCGHVTTRVVDFCPRPDCVGKIVRLDTLQAEEYKKDRYAINHTLTMKPLGLVTREHTAHIEADTSEKNEEFFINGFVNLLSSSTTMELGIDIGGLTAVYLSNCPPGPANYLQRAGRAGRRIDGTSIVLTNARKLPHDSLLFFDPRYFFDNKPVDPMVSMSSKKIIKRHINAFLLAEFFYFLNKNKITINKTSNPLNAFGSCKDFFIEEVLYNDEIHIVYRLFFSWLKSEAFNNKELAEKYRQIVDGTFYQSIDKNNVFIPELMQSIYDIGMEYRKDMELLEKEIYKADGNRSKALNYKKNRIMNLPLIEYLSNLQILPKYGFPIDVVPFDDINKDKARALNVSDNSEDTIDGGAHQDKLKMQRTLTRAIVEYAPGNKIIANKRVLISEGIMFNSLGLGLSEKKESLDKGYYVICKSCNSFEYVSIPEEYQRCKICNHPSDKCDLDPEKDIDYNDTIPRNKVKTYLVPKGFRVDFNEKQLYAKAIAPIKGYSIIKPLMSGTGIAFKELYKGNIKVRHLDNGELIAINHGKEDREGFGFGFAICLSCGRAAREENDAIKYKLPMASNHVPVDGRRGNCQSQTNRNISLLAKITTDTLQIRMEKDMMPSLDVINKEIYYTTLGKAMVIAGAQMLNIEVRELNYSLSAYRLEDGANNFDIVIYDDVPGGAGYVKQLASRISELLQMSFKVLDECDNNCDKACGRCIATYELENYSLKKLNRKLVVNFLKQDVQKSMVFGEYSNWTKKYSSEMFPYTYSDDFFRSLGNTSYREVTWFFHQNNAKDYDVMGNMENIIHLMKKNTVVNFVFKYTPTVDQIPNGFMKLMLWKKDYGNLLNFYQSDSITTDYLAVFRDFTDTFTCLINPDKSSDNFLGNEQELEATMWGYSLSSWPEGLPVLKDVKPIKIEMPADVVIVETPSQQHKSLSDIFISLCGLSEDNRIKQIYFTDKYICTKLVLATLYDLLEKLPKTEDARLTIVTFPAWAKESRTNFDITNRHDHLSEFQRLFKELNWSSEKISLFFTEKIYDGWVNKDHLPGYQHQREVLIVDASDKHHRLMIDPGIDIYQPGMNNDYLQKYQNYKEYSFRKGVVMRLNSQAEGLDLRIKEAWEKKYLRKCDLD